MAEHAAELDLDSPRVKGFIALLKEHGTVSDPTLAAFEGMFIGRGRRDRSQPGRRWPTACRRRCSAASTAAACNPPADQMQRYRDSYRAMQNMVKALHDAGVTIVAGTDALAGFALHRELELYVEAGIPAPEVLRIATLGAAQVMKRDQRAGLGRPRQAAPT